MNSSIFGTITLEEEGGCDGHADSCMIRRETIGRDSAEGELFGRDRKIECLVGSGSFYEKFDDIVGEEDEYGIEEECEGEVYTL